MIEFMSFAVFGIFVVGFVVTIIVSVMQFAMMRSIFGLAMNQVKQQIDAGSPKTCSFCSSAILPGESKCPNCGSSRGPVNV